MKYANKVFVFMILAAASISYGMYSRVFRPGSQRAQTATPGVRPRPTLSSTQEPTSPRTYSTSSTQQAKKHSPTWSFVRKYTWVPFRDSRIVQGAADAISTVFPTLPLKVDLDKVSPEQRQAFKDATGRELPYGVYRNRVKMGPGYLRRAMNQLGKDWMGIENLYEAWLHSREYARYGEEYAKQKFKSESPIPEKLPDTVRNDYYKRIGLESNKAYTDREIDSAFKKAMMAHHPDRYPREKRAAAEAITKDINSARELYWEWKKQQIK